MKQASLTEAKDRLSAFVRESRNEDVIITVHGRPAAVLKGFIDEDDYFEYRLMNDPRFKRRIARSRKQFEQGAYKMLEDIEE